MLMHAIRDGIVVGALERSKIVCGNCREPTCGIHITSIIWPEEMKDLHKGNTLIFERANKQGYKLGIGCGCYGRAHRQIAHVVDAIRKRGR